MDREARQGFLEAHRRSNSGPDDSARWATVAGYGLYFYAAERHRRPHVDVRRGGEHATLDVVTGEVLAGELPPRVLVLYKLSWKSRREAAMRPFNETLEHCFPGSLDAGTKATDD